MSTNRYALGCECGQTVPVEPRQAGQQVRCGCGRTLAVPPLGRMRNLPPAAAPEAGAARQATRRRWTRTQGYTFVLGMVLLVGGGITAALNGSYYRQLGSLPGEKEISADWDKHIDHLSVEETWDFWVSVRNEQLGVQHPNVVAMVRKQTDLTWRWIVGALISVAIGTGLVVASFVIRPGSKPH